MLFLPLGSMVDGFEKAEKANQTAFDNALANDRKLQRQDEFFIQAPAREAAFQLETDTTLGAVDNLRPQVDFLAKAKSNLTMGNASTRSLLGLQKQQQAKYMIPNLPNIAHNQADTALANSSNAQYNASEVKPRQMVQKANQVDSQGRLLPVREANTRQTLQTGTAQSAAKKTLIPQQTRVAGKQLNRTETLLPNQVRNEVQAQNNQFKLAPELLETSLTAAGANQATNRLNQTTTGATQELEIQRQNIERNNVNLQSAYSSIVDLSNVPVELDPQLAAQKAQQVTQQLQVAGMLAQTDTVTYLPQEGWVIAMQTNEGIVYNPIQGLTDNITQQLQTTRQQATKLGTGLTMEQKIQLAQQKADIGVEASRQKAGIWEKNQTPAVTPTPTATSATGKRKGSVKAQKLDILGVPNQVTTQGKPSGTTNKALIAKLPTTIARATAKAKAENPNATTAQLKVLIEKHTRILAGM